MQATADQIDALKQVIRQLADSSHAEDQQYLADHLPAAFAAQPAGVQKKAQAAHFNHSELQLLSALGDDVVPYSELSARLPFSQGLMSRYVKRLVETGLVVKQPIGTNKKSYALATTSLGKQAAAFHADMHARDDARLAAALQTIDAPALATTLAVLKQLATVLAD
ncbi:winged helix-turn-helix domain-containing protein [Lacticaseibacillus yichunensis]|uniref:MarR family transcriptional regulator n=1 Tax=Lacticaseibacillus yichunensis TaxID=2486015 RepID=A0ABW4CKT9_9LACO|nr:winged helix-turn-helix domain-containing protein [Lacticaseibacillus yichunensis]